MRKVASLLQGQEEAGARSSTNNTAGKKMINCSNDDTQYMIAFLT